MKLPLTVVMALFLATLSLSTYGQEKKSVDLNSVAVSSRGTNPKIKADRPTTDAPAASRGSGECTCYLYLSNYTGYTIDVYVDGYWETSLGAYDDATVSTGNGYTTVYGISAGKTKEWDFTGATCKTSYTYNFRN